MNARAVGHALHWPQSWRATAWAVVISAVVSGAGGCGTVSEGSDLTRGKSPSGGSGERAREAVPLPMPPAPRLMTVEAAVMQEAGRC